MEGNIFRVKPGCEQQFIDFHKSANPAFKGFRGGAVVKTGERMFCLVGEWASFQKIAEARPSMIGLLDSTRDLLEDQGAALASPSAVAATQGRVSRLPPIPGGELQVRPKEEDGLLSNGPHL